MAARHMRSLRAVIAVVGAWGGEIETWLRYLGLGLIMLLVRRVMMVRVGRSDARVVRVRVMGSWVMQGV